MESWPLRLAPQKPDGNRHTGRGDLLDPIYQLHLKRFSQSLSIQRSVTRQPDASATSEVREVIVPKARPVQYRGKVLSGTERGSFRSQVPSTSQDLAPWRSRLLTLSNAQRFSTYTADFYV